LSDLHSVFAVCRFYLINAMLASSFHGSKLIPASQSILP
jgi:hypothetical protein